MIKEVQACVNCPKEMSCLGGACPYRGAVEICDNCQSEFADYIVSGGFLNTDVLSLCDECAEYLASEYYGLSFMETIDKYEYDWKVIK